MFTGLIRDIGEVVDVRKPENGDLYARIKTNIDPKDLTLGASIACSGVCLTVVAYADGVFDVQASSETLSKTKLDSWRAGTKLNLEPSLRMGDELGGHFVFGHVDGLAQIVSVREDGESHHITVKPSADLHKFMAAKGSVSLDGTSLTINHVDAETFDIMIIPHTWDHTTFGTVSAGDVVHIEIDMLARYTARILESR